MRMETLKLEQTCADSMSKFRMDFTGECNFGTKIPNLFLFSYSLNLSC